MITQTIYCPECRVGSQTTPPGCIIPGTRERTPWKWTCPNCGSTFLIEYSYTLIENQEGESA